MRSILCKQILVYILFRQQERLNEVENAVKELSKLTKQLIDKLDYIESVKKQKI